MSEGVKDDILISDTLIKLAHSVVELIVLKYALQGGGQTVSGTKKTANLFIVNDNSTKTGAANKNKIYIFSMDELLSYLSKYNECNEKKGFAIESNGSALENFRPIQRWSTTKEERIKNVLLQVHQQKINASIKASTIKELGKTIG